MKQQIDTQHIVLSQKSWNTPSQRSSPLSPALARKLRNQLKHRGYIHAFVVQVVSLK